MLTHLLLSARLQRIQMKQISLIWKVIVCTMHVLKYPVLVSSDLSASLFPGVRTSKSKTPKAILDLKDGTSDLTSKFEG